MMQTTYNNEAAAGQKVGARLPRSDWFTVFLHWASAIAMFTRSSRACASPPTRSTP